MIRRLLLACIFVSCGLAAGIVLTGRMRSAEEARAASPQPVPQAPAPQPAASGFAGLPDLSSVASRAIPSVMNITSLNVVRQNSPFTSDPLFRYFFGDEMPRNRVSQSLG